MSITAIAELVHLLGDHIGALPHPGEHPNIFKHGTLTQSVARASHDRCKRGHERLPTSRVWRKNVMHPHGGLVRTGVHVVSHVADSSERLRVR
jgi:hypothetical protein